MSNLIDTSGGFPGVPQKVIFGAHGLLVKPTSPGAGVCSRSGRGESAPIRNLFPT